MEGSATSFGVSMAPRSEPRAVPRVGEKDQDPDEPEDHALGRSRGGWGSKIHILCDSKGHPLHFCVTAGQVHDSATLDTLLADADGTLHDEDGVVMAWPLKLAGDKGYRAAWIDEYLLELGMDPVIPCKKGENPNKRPVSFDNRAYRRRSIVERLIGWLN